MKSSLTKSEVFELQCAVSDAQDYLDIAMEALKLAHPKHPPAPICLVCDAMLKLGITERSEK